MSPEYFRKVEDARIKTIRNTSGGMTGPVKASSQQEIMAIQQDMIADGSIIQLILALQSDPDFQEALQDESIMMAIKLWRLKRFNDQSEDCEVDGEVECAGNQKKAGVTFWTG